MANYRNDFADVNLETGTICRNFMNHSIGSGDALGDRFGVRVFRNGEPVSLGGTVAGYFVRNTTGETVVISSGVVSGNEAYVTLPAACYAVEGSFTLAIKVTSGSETVTMRIIDGVVSRTNTSVTVDPGTLVPSIETLISAINSAVGQIPVNYNASFAPAYSASSTYAVGDYVVYDGYLWRCTTAITDTESWTAAHWTKVALASDMSDLKSAFEQYTEGLGIQFFSKYNVPVNISSYLHSSGYVLINDSNVLEYRTGNSYKYYEIPTTDLHRVYISGCFTVSNIKGVVFTDDSLNVKSRYPVANASSPGLDNQSYECFVPEGATKLFIVAKSATTVSMVKLDYFQASDDLNKAIGVKDLSIEGYDKAIEAVTGTLYTDQMHNGNALVSLEGWYCLEFTVKPSTKYWMSGTGNPMINVYDAYGNRIDQYKPGSNVSKEGYEYTTGNNAAKVYLNRKTYKPYATEQQTYCFVSEFNLAKTIGENQFRVGHGLFQTEIGLFSSNNGALNFTSLKYNDETFKGVNDDIAPIYTDAEYIGANHGYNFGYTCTATSHGLTDADIGKTYNDGTNTWILLKVLSEDTFLIGCYDSSKWYKLKTGTVPGSVNFGSPITVSSSSRSQIRPCMKNISVSVYENKPNRFRVMESYDLIDIGTGVTALMANQGNNDNDSLVALSDNLIRVSTLYEFNNSGAVTLYEEIELLKTNVAEISYAYGTQAQAFTGNDQLAVLGTSIDVLQTAVTNVASSTWDNPNKAPSVFIKMKSTNDNGFVVAYIKDRTNLLGSTAGEVNGTSKKLYPRMMSNSTKQAGVYSNIILRMPIKKNESGADFLSYSNVGDDVYIFVGNLTAKTVDVSVPADIFGKSVTVVDKNDNITLQTDNVVSTIKMTTTGEGWALLKVS